MFKIEKINGFWVPSTDNQMEQWRTDGTPFMQDRCLKSFIKYCKAQHKKFNRVLDVGAWCGTWSQAMQEFCKSITAFEPNTVHFDCLQKNLGAFNHITCNRNAIGNKNCKISLTDEGATQNTRVKNELGNIPMHTIDYYNYSDVDFIKIDVEGYEMRVLQGANKTLTINDENQSNVKFLMVELNHNTEKYESSSLEVKKHIKSLGFNVLINIWPDIIYYRT